MNLKRALFRGLSELYSIPNADQAGLRILMYHAIGTDLRDLGPKGHLFSISPETFKRQMLALKQNSSIKMASLAALPQDLESDNWMAISFDDGYADNLLEAAPVLKAYGFPFTVFAVPGAIQDGKKGYLSVEQLKELARVPGCQIGSHSMNHVHLTEQNDSALKAELSDSRRWLEDTLSQPVRTLAYPYGAADRRVRDAAQAAGYTLGVCSHSGINKNDRDPLLLCRTTILDEDDERMFELKSSGGWDWYRWRHTDPAAG